MKRALLYILILGLGKAFAQSPGGVSNGIIFWLKADAGTNTTTDGAAVLTWDDQTINNNDGFDIEANDPLYEEVQTNFNPAIDYTSASNAGGIGLADDGGINLGNHSAKGFSIVFRTAADITTRQVLYEEGGGTHGMNLYIQSSTLISNIWNNSADRNNSTSITANTNYIATYIYDGANTRWDLYLNGSLVTNRTDATGTLPQHTDDIGIGAVNGGTQFPTNNDVSTSEGFEGHIMEMTYFNGVVLSIADRNQIESYLSVKYGVPTDTTLTASDGTTLFWSEITNSGYVTDVTAIGRDDNSGLNQKQSTSANESGMVTMGLGSIATSNANNANTFSIDKSFLAWGNNAGANTFSTTGAPSGRNILARVWRVQETGTVGTVRVQVPDNSSSKSVKLLDIGQVSLVIDDDNDFTNGVTSITPMTLNGTEWEVDVDFSNGDYFSFAGDGAKLSVTQQGDEDGPVNIIYTVTLPQVNGGAAVTFDIDDAGTGTATSGVGNDYTAFLVNDQITVNNGSQTGTYTVTVLDDVDSEPTETVIATISNSSNPNIPIQTASATALIRDNEISSPGGVFDNLIFWYKADEGVTGTSPVTAWADQSGTGLTLTESTGGQGPDLVSVLANFNPAIDFTGASTGALDMGDDDSVNTTNPFTAKSFMIAFRTGTDVNTRQTLYEQGGTGAGVNMYIESNELRANLWDDPDENTASASIVANTDYIATYVWDGTIGTPTVSLTVNGTAGTGVSGALSPLGTHGGDPGIGAVNGNTQFGGNITSSDEGDAFDGYFMEMVYYDSKVFTSTEQIQIESHMGLKYGIDLNQNFIASDGTTTYWNTTTNSGFTTGVIGIGQDVSAELEQLQSKSANSDALLTIGLDTIVTDNASHPVAFAADKDFFMIGHNNGAVSFSNTGAPIGTLVLGRKWKVQETGTVGSIKMQFPASTSSESTKLPAANYLFLVVDGDDDLTNGFVSSTPMTLNGTNWEVEVDFTTGQFFTVMSSEANLTVTSNGDENGPVNIEFTLTLNATNNSGSPITFDFDDLGTGTATSGMDYVAIGGSAQLSIADGQSTGTFTVTVNDDGFDEPVEGLDVQLSNPSSSAINIVNSTISATIADDDISAPGGVSTFLTFWLKANVGTSTTSDGNTNSAWTDQSSGGNNATGTGTAPLYRTISANFNPGLDFSNSTTGGLTIANDDSINVLTYTRKSYIIAFKTGSDVTSRQLIYEQGGATNGLNLYLQSGNLFANIWNNSADNAAASSQTIVANTIYIVAWVFDGDNTRWDMYINGEATASASDATTMTVLSAHTGAIGLGVIVNDTEFDGNIDVGSGEGFRGEIMEMIYYNGKVFSAADRNQLASYLAVKYGVTLNNTGGGTAGDYIAPNGTTTYWDASDNSTYHNDVSGLASDATSIMEQKQSLTENTDGVITIGLNPIAADNLSNGGSFSLGNEYLMWGNDNGDLTGVASNASLTPQSGDVDILSRIWKIVETNTIGTVQIAITQANLESYFTFDSYGSFAIKIADDASFTTNVQYVDLSLTTINSVSHYAGTHDFTGTKFFTIAQRNAIIWTGTEWRGGLSTITNHGPSDEAGDAGKTLTIRSGSAATIDEPVVVTNGAIESGATLNLNPDACLVVSGTMTNTSGTFNLLADATGYAQYKGSAVSGVYRQYTAKEGWHLIGSPFSDATWADLTFASGTGFINHPIDGSSLTECSYCNLWFYDPSTDNGSNIGFGASNAYGTWRSSTNSSQSFDVDKGWNLFLDSISGFSTGPWTLQLTGTFNNGTISQDVNENNGGWNLVANPYPSAIDWTIVDDGLGAAGIALGYHVWNETNDNYAVYTAAGGGTHGANQFIPPFQSFYVQTAVEGGQNSGDVIRTFELTNADRPDGCEIGKFFKTQSQDRILIRTTHHGSNKIDETIIAFNDQASYDFNRNEDIHKILALGSDITSVYSQFGDEKAAISLVPYPSIRDSVLLGVNTVNETGVTIEIVERPRSMTIYLEDVETGIFYRADDPLRYQQSTKEKYFVLHYGSDTEVIPFQEAPFQAFINQDGLLEMQLARRVRGGEWVLTSIAGNAVRRGTVNEDSGSTQFVDVQNLQSGVYIMTFVTDGEKHSQKIPIIR